MLTDDAFNLREQFFIYLFLTCGFGLIGVVLCIVEDYFWGLLSFALCVFCATCMVEIAIRNYRMGSDP